MQIAYADAAGRKNPRAIELGGGNIGGKVLLPGLYKWSSNVIIPANVTLSGSENAVWIFQIAGNLNIWSGKKVILSGGALPKNIFWQVAGKPPWNDRRLQRKYIRQDSDCAKDRRKTER
jgi:hypothetical protein